MDLLICTAREQDEWAATMAACLPEARVHSGHDAPACDYAVLWKPPDALFARQPRLRAIFSLGAGVDGLLALPSLPSEVPLVRIEDAGMAAQMIDYAHYVVLREFRGFRHYEAAQREQRWAPLPMPARAAFRVAVLGLGVLGAAVATALAQAGFAVSGWSRSAKTIDGVRCVAGAEALEPLLAASDLVLLMLPLTSATRGLIDRARLACLPPGAVLVNLARGGLVDESALLAALDEGRLAAAYLDVCQQEPPPPGHRFWLHPRVQLTPHVAALTPFEVACRQVAAKIRRLEAGQPISGSVDRQRGY